MTPGIRLNPSAGVTPTHVGVILSSDLGTFQVSGADAGAFLEEMVPLLDGSRDQRAILAALPAYAPDSVTALLELLQSYGLLETTDPEAGERGREREDRFRAWADAPTRPLAGARALVVGREPWIEAAAIELGAAGVGTIHRVDDRAAGALEDLGELEPFHVLLVAAAPDDEARIERVSRFAHRAGIVSLWSHLAGTTAVLGPLVTPGQTACRLCAAAEALNPAAPPETPAAPRRAAAMAQLVGHLLAMEALKVASGAAPSKLGGRLVIQDLVTLATTRHGLVRLPWCRICG